MELVRAFKIIVQTHAHSYKLSILSFSLSSLLSSLSPSLSFPLSLPPSLSFPFSLPPSLSPSLPPSPSLLSQEIPTLLRISKLSGVLLDEDVTYSIQGIGTNGKTVDLSQFACIAKNDRIEVEWARRTLHR